MIFYNLLYLTTHWYLNASRCLDKLVYKPFIAMKRQIVDKSAIEKVSIIDLQYAHSCSLIEDLYHIKWYHYCYRFFMLYVFKTTLPCIYHIYDNRLEYTGVYMYVRLSNGTEYLTNKPFDSKHLCQFEKPRTRYLCILLGNIEITRFMKRFWTSWSHLKLHHHDFILLACTFDRSIRRYTSYMKRLDHTIVLVDDDNFEETYINTNECLQL